MGRTPVQRRPPQRLDFSDEEGSHIEIPVEDIGGRGAGAGEREVEAIIVELRGWVSLFLNSYRDGLESFETSMSFASDEEAEPRYFDVALKEVGKVLMDELIDYATTGFPTIAAVVKGAKSVLQEMYDESKRAEAAAGEARIRSYVVETRNAITAEGGVERQLLQVMDEARPALLALYHDAVNASTAGAPDQASGAALVEGQGTHGHLTGESATFVRELRAQVDEFKSKVPTARAFQRGFTERFADTPGLSDYISQGGQESGSLHFNIDLLREHDDTGWSYTVEERALRGN